MYEYVKNVLFWDVMLCILVKPDNISEEYITSIIMLKNKPGKKLA
jgi:hypothetical protein